MHRSLAFVVVCCSVVACGGDPAASRSGLQAVNTAAGETGGTGGTGGAGGRGGSGGSGGGGFDPRRVPADLAAASGETPLAGVWEGPVRLDAPNFAGPPVDYMKLVLEDHALRFFAFDKFAQWARFDLIPEPDGVGTARFFAGMAKLLVLAKMHGGSDFSLRYRMQSGEGPGSSDFTEALTGSWRDGRLAVSYTIAGRLYGSAIDGQAQGLLTKRGSRPGIPAALAGALWSGEVDLVSPHIVGAPRDHLTLGFHDDGRLSFVGFSTFPERQAFGDRPDVFPLAGQRTVRPTDSIVVRDVEVLAAAWSARAFRITVAVTGVHDDYRQTVSGELGEQGLDARATIDGKYWGVTTGVRANGRLRP